MYNQHEWGRDRGQTMTFDTKEIFTGVFLIRGFFYPLWPVMVLTPLRVNRRNQLSITLLDPCLGIQPYYLAELHLGPNSPQVRHQSHQPLGDEVLKVFAV